MRDRIRHYFEKQYGIDAVLLGDFTKVISGDQFETIKKYIGKIQDETGLSIMITEFHADDGLNSGQN